MDGVPERLDEIWQQCEKTSDLRFGQVGTSLLALLEARLAVRSIDTAEVSTCVVHRIQGKHLKLVNTSHDIVLAIVRPSSASAAHLAEAYRDLKQNVPSDAVVFAFTTTGVAEFRKLAKTALMPIVALDKTVVTAMASNSARPHKVLQEHLAEQVGLIDLNPYEAAGPVRPAMFYGRQDDLKRLLSTLNKGVSVIGQRGIGKSSLLLAAYRRCLDERNHTPAYVDAEVYKSPEALADALYRRLLPHDHERNRQYELDEVLARARGSNPILLLLDEMDNVVRACSQAADWSLFVRLQSAILRGDCRVIMAGYRDLRHAILSKQHRLYNFLDRLELGPLSPPDARQLIVEPLTNLGIGFADVEGTVRQITDWSSGHPAYIQTYCAKLLERAHRATSRQVNKVDLDAVEQDASLYSYIVSTFLQDTPALEKCIVYAVLGRPSFHEADIDDRLQSLNLYVGMNRIVQACDNLTIANVFAREAQGFRFLFNGFCRAIREHLPPERVLKRFLDEARAEEGRP